jgi:hypothetical protein
MSSSPAALRRSLFRVVAVSGLGASLGAVGRAGDARSGLAAFAICTAVLVALAQQTLP